VSGGTSFAFSKKLNCMYDINQWELDFLLWMCHAIIEFTDNQYRLKVQIVLSCQLTLWSKPSDLNSSIKIFFFSWQKTIKNFLLYEIVWKLDTMDLLHLTFLHLLAIMERNGTNQNLWDPHLISHINLHLCQSFF
jgi:hypothetical protein